MFSSPSFEKYKKSFCQRFPPLVWSTKRKWYHVSLVPLKILSCLSYFWPNYECNSWKILPFSFSLFIYICMYIKVLEHSRHFQMIECTVKLRSKRDQLKKMIRRARMYKQNGGRPSRKFFIRRVISKWFYNAQRETKSRFLFIILYFNLF